MQTIEKKLIRTHWCTDLTRENVNQTVTVAGWVSTVRDLGGVIFIELRDVQVYFSWYLTRKRTRKFMIYSLLLKMNML